MYRRQASLYLDSPHLETQRLRHNPIQARLIPAHVTLCREDEVDDWVAFAATLNSLSPFELSLGFGTPIRENNFVFLPVRDGLADFHEFRRLLLTHEPRVHTPHVTLIHPRNGECTDSIFAEITRSIPPFRVTFREVMLIEQTGDRAWNVVARVGAKA